MGTKLAAGVLGSKSEVSGSEHRDGCRHRELSAAFGAAWEERRRALCLCVVTVLSGVTGLFWEDLVNRELSPWTAASEPCQGLAAKAPE